MDGTIRSGLFRHLMTLVDLQGFQLHISSYGSDSRRKLNGALFDAPMGRSNGSGVDGLGRACNTVAQPAVLHGGLNTVIPGCEWPPSTATGVLLSRTSQACDQRRLELFQPFQEKSHTLARPV
jgi:hypothetical protein